MGESSRTRFLKKIYKNEIKELLYEEYVSSNNIKLIRTHMLLNDEFSTLLRLDELGIISEAKIKYLEMLHYKNMHNEEVIKILKIK